MIYLLLFAIFIFAPILPAQQHLEEQVIVTANAYPVPFENLSRAVTVLTREDIDNLPVRSIADVLAQAASVDLRSRSPFGMQADLSLRGAAFSQALIMVDGVRMNDSQTGHHNADFPVQLQDIERIEVLLGSGSSIYGADAFGGIVNIITKKEAVPLQASVSGGQNGFFEASVSAGFNKGKFRQSISASGNTSYGFRYDRDFRSIAVSSRTSLGDHTAIFVSHTNKEFGANGFYGPAPSKEWTNQTLISFDHRHEGHSGTKTVYQGYYRTHGDRFLYDIHFPGMYENTHRTHSTGVLMKASFKLGEARSLTLGGEAGGDWIVSSNLGDHSFARMSCFSELQWMFGKTIAIYPGLRFDHYSNFGSSASPSLSGSWWVWPRIRLRSSVGRAFRIPTFTELYYWGPNYQADPTLKPESAWSTELGTDFIPSRNWLASLTLFDRRERNVIDWIRASASEKWRTANIQKLHTAGLDLGLERSLGSHARLSAHYSYISTDAKSPGFYSKYVLDFARHSGAVSTGFPLPLKMKYQQTLNYKRRANGRDYWLLDNRLERSFPKFAIAADFTNLLNSRYQDVIGVDMPGRWFVVSLRTR
jgi:outer membrane cobalamin receptor